jgi:hypothetical protein
MRIVVVMLALAGCGTSESPTAPAPATKPTPSPAPAPVPSPSGLPPAYARLAGKTPGSLGPAFASIRLGEHIDPKTLPSIPNTKYGLGGDAHSDVLSPGPTEPGPRVLVDLIVRSGKLLTFNAELLTERGSIPDDDCKSVRAAFDQLWGASPDHVWIDRSTHTRAALLDTCRLEVERYVEPAAWIGTDATAIVPLDAVGKSPTVFASRIDPDMALGDGITYWDAGVGEHSNGGTEVDVYVHKGVVIGLSAQADADPADRELVRARITALTGKQPKRDAKTGDDVWASRIPIRMPESKRGVRIEVGRLMP